MSIDKERRNETCEQVFNGTNWLTDSVAESDRFRQWEAEGKIFSVTCGVSKYYATYQFNEQGFPLSIVQKILCHLNGDDPWSVAAWFHFPNGWITEGTTPISPKNALHMHDEVVRAASNSRGSYVA